MTSEQQASTAGPWVAFSDNGRTVAIMPAGRDGDICKFDGECANVEANANLILRAPALLKLIEDYYWVENKREGRRCDERAQEMLKALGRIK